MMGFRVRVYGLGEFIGFVGFIAYRVKGSGGLSGLLVFLPSFEGFTASGA